MIEWLEAANPDARTPFAAVTHGAYFRRFGA